MQANGMEYEDLNVSDDHIVLQEVIARHGLTAKQLAAWTGLAQSTIYRYLSGQVTIPSIIWRAIYERTLDYSILRLITGCLPHAVVPLFVAGKPIATDKSLSTMARCRKIQIECELLAMDLLAMDLLAEGKTDAAVMARYRDTFGKSIVLQSQIYQSITGDFTPVQMENE
jgi:predicted DNA-binding transcriptional regulator AlpA